MQNKTLSTRRLNADTRPNRTPTTSSGYEKPRLIAFGSLRQIVRGASAKGVDSAGELDLATYPF